LFHGRQQVFAGEECICLIVGVKNPQVTGPREASDDGLDALYKWPDFRLRRAHQISVSQFMEEAGKLDATTTTQYGILVILQSFDGLDQISHSKKVGLDRSTTGLVIKKLEDEGHIVRIEGSKDRRRKVIVLAARGRRKLEQLRGPATRRNKLPVGVIFCQHIEMAAV
jgi:MarR family transcriptional regulator, lower aerobic nicotinate degradation pathway regulator